MSHPAIEKGRTAVITGGASGIGLAAAQRYLSLGMNVCVADRDNAALEAAQDLLGREALVVKTDVSSLAEVESLRDEVFSRFGDVAVLMNNAGVGGGGGPFSGYAGWQKVLAVNLWGVVNGVHAFAEAMLEQKRPAAIINTGSKQGITNPPGDTAYNVSKAGIRTLTESLAHTLDTTENCEVTAHLLVPGFTYTGMIKRFLDTKPDAAWTSEQVVDRMLEQLGNGDFYIICPDNDVTTALDHARIQWNTDDILKNRPALSRWNPDFEAEFAAAMKKA